jgi:hypothetical protein
MPSRSATDNFAYVPEAVLTETRCATLTAPAMARSIMKDLVVVQKVSWNTGVVIKLRRAVSGLL